MRVVLQPRPLTESVTVTASRGATGVDTAASATIVSSAELLTSAAGAVDDALRNTPGFSLFRRSSSRVANPTTQGVTLRGVSGSGASRTLVVADGWALNDPFGSWVYWNRIPLAAVDRIEVVRGATGDLYGADALGGVIQVLTLDAERPRLRGLFEAGSHETYRASGFGGRRFGNWSLSGGAEVAEHRRRLHRRRRGSAAPWTCRPTATTVGLRRRRLRQRHVARDVPRQRRQRKSRQRHAAAGQRHRVAPVRGRREWRPGGRLLDGAHDRRQPGLFPDVLGDCRRSPDRTADERSTVPGDFVTGGGQWMRTWKAADVLVGAEGRQTTADINETRYAVDGRAGVHVAARPRGAERVRVRTRAVRASHPISRSSSARAAITGSRRDSKNFFSPRASLTWRANDLASLQFSVARSYRTPTLNELYRGFRVGNIVTNANPLLEPERLDERRGRRAPRPRPRLGPRHGVPQRARRCDLEHHAVDDAGVDHTRAAECRPARVVGRRGRRGCPAASARHAVGSSARSRRRTTPTRRSSRPSGQPRAAGAALFDRRRHDCRDAAGGDVLGPGPVRRRAVRGRPERPWCSTSTRSSTRRRRGR